MPVKRLNKDGPKPAGFGRVIKRTPGPRPTAALGALGALGKGAVAAGVGVNDLVLRPNPRKRKATSPKVRGPLSWQLDNTQLPGSLLRSNISTCEIDFLDLADGTPNHVTMRLMLQHRKKNDTDQVPAGTTGIKLSFELDIGFVSLRPIVHKGFFNAELISYTGPHPKAARTVVLPVPGPDRKTASDFMNLLPGLYMLPCGFNPSGSDLVGSSDFMSQLIWHYSEAGLVEVPTTPAASFLWPAFNLHHSLPSDVEPVEPVATRVLPAAFPRTYVRADIPGVPVGTLAPVAKRSPKAGRGGRRV
ncbi:hypothetical protein N7452_005407 [Penicillium brevicompactum]|uniref:Uncharacterized protein n=1 Tax=Penicillium brevicompactum TaxID=5074 RepID=A0A9W9QL20_PENBR|nr:hypothetical protein N7452_005407 [Penicillium brevicompactum]